MSAVLVPLLEKDQRVHVLFTKRTDKVEHHQGEVSFPGGVFEKGDDSPLQVALRETEEEIGISPDNIEPLGFLDDTDTTTGFVITPVVGWLPSSHDLSINRDEIDRVFDVSVKALSAPDILEVRPWKTPDGRMTKVNLFHVGPDVVWGATGRILKSFLDILGENSLLDLCL